MVSIGHSDAGEFRMLLAGTCGPPRVDACDAALEGFPNPRRVGPPTAAAPPTRPAVRRNSRRFILPHSLAGEIVFVQVAAERAADRSRERVGGLAALVRPLTEVLDRPVEIDHDEQALGFG